MEQYILKSAIVAEIERRQKVEVFYDEDGSFASWEDQNHYYTLETIKNFIDHLAVEEVDLKKESELIANGIMIGVQANKYHTCVYNTQRCDFNHSHLMLAARKGIELGLKIKKGE